MNKIFTKEQADTRLISALFHGKRGVGKRTSILQIIQECSPGVDPSKITEINTCDIVELRGNEGINIYKEKLSGFDTHPKELPHRWLICYEIEQASKEVNNYLLKLVEDRKFFHIFITSYRKEQVNPALLSRLHTYGFPCLQKEQLLHILQQNPQGQVLLQHTDKYPFCSVFELQTYFQLSLEESFTGMFLQSKTSGELLHKVKDLLQKIKDVPAYERQETYLFVLDFILYRLQQERKYSDRPFLFHLRRFKMKYLNSLFAETPSYAIQIENQITAFILSVFILRQGLALPG